MSYDATVAAEEVIDRGDELFERMPTLTTLHINDAGGLVEKLAKVPHLRRLTTLSLSGSWVAPGEASALAKSSHLTDLQSLVMHNCALGDEGLREFAAASNLVHLRQWFLTDNGLTDEGLAALADSQRFQELASLCFGHYGLSAMRYDSITRQGLLGVAGSSQLTRLATIHWYELTDQRGGDYKQTSEEVLPVPRGVRLVTHVEQIW